MAPKAALRMALSGTRNDHGVPAQKDGRSPGPLAHSTVRRCLRPSNERPSRAVAGSALDFIGAGALLLGG
jgi:hypothetical protein